MMQSNKYGDFSVYVDGELLTVFSGVAYSKVFDLMEPLLDKYPDVDVEVRFKDSV